jgi:hypothetical protein
VAVVIVLRLIEPLRLPQPATAEPWAATVAALLGAALAPLIHELGHVAGGLLAGFRFVWLVWGPLEVRREGDRMRLALNRRLSLAGGLALCLPPNGQVPLRGLAGYVGGGPVLSLVAGSAALAGAWGMPDRGSVGGWAAAAFGLASLVIALLTLIPSRGDFLSDGAQLLRILRHPALARRDLAVAALSGLALSPQRPRDWPADLLAQVAAKDEPPSATAFYLRYLHALDLGKPHEAREHLQQALFTTPATPLATELALEAAFFEVAIRRDAEQSRRWLERAHRTLDRTFLQAVQAAVLSGQPDRQVALPDILQLTQRLGARSGVDALRAERLLDSTPSRKLEAD